MRMICSPRWASVDLAPRRSKTAGLCSHMLTEIDTPLTFFGDMIDSFCFGLDELMAYCMKNDNQHII